MVQLAQGVNVRKRDGRTVPFGRERIEEALAKAFKAEANTPDTTPLDPALAAEISEITDAVIADVQSSAREGEMIEVERIQDKVEIQLMRAEHYSVARRYIVYREGHTRARVLSGREAPPPEAPKLRVLNREGKREPLDPTRIRMEIYSACDGLAEVDASDLLEEVYRTLYDDIKPEDIERAMILAARQRVEREPSYGEVAARLLLNVIDRHALGEKPAQNERGQVVVDRFEDYLESGVRSKRLDGRLLNYDLDTISAALKPERDFDFGYLGLQTIFDRYLIHISDRRIETPQFFWMRVAMGLALEEDEMENRAIQFYEMLSSFRFVSATPTLFNSGTRHPQLSSCYLSTAQDDLEHIFKVISDNAKLSKWAGGLGNDWTNVRATNAHIAGTNGKSQGVVPFLKVVNDTAVAVNQGGKRKGAVCAYLETWHLDIEDFIELRKNTGDDRRRTHDMNTANWIPDLFMKRVEENGKWTLFTPDEVSDLHDLYGKAFEERYTQYEAMVETGEIKHYRQIDAVMLWRKMLSMLFETGHPWITFKDPSNIRSPQSHIGVVHSSNLCTEILLNTSEDETAVCNLGSVNLAAHTKPSGVDYDMMGETIDTAVRMLDNVIDINFYPTPEAKNSNQRHRPVGLGLMGFQDMLYILRAPNESDQAVELADRTMEFISFHAVMASTRLAADRGPYSSYQGSKWDQGHLPIDTIDILAEERGGYVEVDRSASLDWDVAREAVKANGMRNSNVMAIAPTATISNIAGVTQSIEPTYRNLFVKANLSGDFTVINQHMVNDLKRLGLWDEQMVEDLKYFDGSLQEIERIPEDIKAIYKTSFEIDPTWIVEAASRRQKWIDMGQSLNLYISQPSGRALHDMYMLAWKRGLKTTYYLRSLAPTQIEKSTVDINKRGLQPRWMKSRSASSDIQIQRDATSAATPAPEPPQRPEASMAAVAIPPQAAEDKSFDRPYEIPDEMPPATVVGPTCDPTDPDCEACQ
jgi:ribonucleoside-diphosphate reductase alpha chain